MVLNFLSQAYNEFIEYAAKRPYIFYILLIVAVVLMTNLLYSVKQDFFTPCECCINGGRELLTHAREGSLLTYTREGFQDINIETVENKNTPCTHGLAMEGTSELDTLVAGLPLADQQLVNTPTIIPVATTPT